jgi:acetate kinase
MTSVLVLNAGSSSLKFALVDPDSGSRAISGIAERLGTDAASMTVKRDVGEPETRTLAEGSHDAAVAAIVDATGELSDSVQPMGVGHRVVHGGSEFADSVLITAAVVDSIERCSRLAPLHNPPALLGIDAVGHSWPGLAQVAVFDTSFHQTMPEKAYRYAVPEDWYVEHRVRRYGFHGTSHRYVSGRAAELLGRDLADVALVTCHLGNGCSAAAVLAGRSIDTTMGLTPLEGLVMGTRSGDVDPALFGYLESETGMNGREVTDALNKRSGLLGLSGKTNDMRELLVLADSGDQRAVLAIDVFAHRLAKTIAGLAVALRRLDAVVFTGGIGENSAPVRAKVLDSLGLLGLRVDPAANDDHGRSSSGRISSSTAPIALVVPTDEELMIALDTDRLVSAADDIGGGPR